VILLVSVDLNIRIENLPTINKRIARIDGRFSTMSITKFGRAVRDRAKLELRRGYVKKRAAQRTKTLERSIKVQSVDRGKQAIIVATAPHANLVEYGRGVVTPVKKDMLRFIGARGEYVFAKKVRATKPVLFMAKARKWALTHMKDYISRRVDRILQSGGDIGDVGIAASI